MFRVRESGDDPAEGGEGFVDVAPFAQTGAGGFGGFCAFAAGEIDETDAGEAFGCTVGGEIVVDLLEHDGEDGVGARGGVVHFCGGGGAVVVAKAHVAEEFVVVFDGEVGKVFDVGAFGWGFTDLEVEGMVV